MNIDYLLVYRSISTERNYIIYLSYYTCAIDVLWNKKMCETDSDRELQQKPKCHFQAFSIQSATSCNLT